MSRYFVSEPRSDNDEPMEVDESSKCAKVYVNIPQSDTPGFDVIVYRCFMPDDQRPQYNIKLEYAQSNFVLDMETFGVLTTHAQLIYRFHTSTLTSPASVKNLFVGRQVTYSGDVAMECSIPLGKNKAIVFKWNPYFAEDGIIYCIDEQSADKDVFSTDAKDFCYFLRHWANDIEQGILRSMTERRGERYDYGYEEIGKTIMINKY